MRSNEEMLRLIADTAERDENVRAAVLSGSRADSSRPEDVYQDYDVAFLVRNLEPYFNNPCYIERTFGKVLIMQLPDLNDNPGMTLETAEKFTYLTIFEDGTRLDLTVTTTMPDWGNEPMKVLFDREGHLSDNLDNECYMVHEPTQEEFSACCNEFWWCLNNVAKGLRREEIPYAKAMFEETLRPQLNKVVSWYIGTISDFSVSTGKKGKYFKKYLPDSIYGKYLRTYSPPDISKMWTSLVNTCKLFSDLARIVAQDLGLDYNTTEEDGARLYMMNVKGGVYEK
ncbi:MAG: aminoglycoside 6-adenylyltransferase [Oscillospiraceae bacterium]|nr:aminoglycoside 6-adenylyltransferase [Oscillospiraceae bacterium]